ncbi:MAG: cell division transport system permease protein [Candidatus Azotimanducaceae bacterium]|jgi:cell division transport system permease protein|tara:strand:- start:4432 stop:5400 length:969 start_codon:yes stop_codon:yes gene_type:complete
MKESAAGSGAQITPINRSDRFKAWSRHHRQLFRSTLTTLLAQPGALLITWLVIGIALSLPILLSLALRALSEADTRQVIQPAMSVYLSVPSDSETAQGLLQRLRASKAVRDVRLITEQAALLEFSSLSGFGDVLNAFSENPLPGIIEVVPRERDGAGIKLLAQQIQGQAGVDQVNFDAAWLERLSAILGILARVLYALGGLFSGAVILIIGNTLRLTIENQRAEIEITKLFGGSDSFVQRPFIYRGFWLGFGGALLAWMIVQLSLLYLSGPVERLAQSYRSNFALEALGFGESMALFALGALLGILGSWVSVWRYLKQIQPK